MGKQQRPGPKSCAGTGSSFAPAQRGRDQTQPRIAPTRQLLVGQEAAMGEGQHYIAADGHQQIAAVSRP